MTTSSMTPTSRSDTSAKTRTQIKTPGYDWGLLSIIFVLLALGLVMVFSASFARA